MSVTGIQRTVIAVEVPRVTVKSVLRAVRRGWKLAWDFFPLCAHGNRVYLTPNEQVCWDCGRSRVLGCGLLSDLWRYREVR